MDYTGGVVCQSKVGDHAPGLHTVLCLVMIIMSLSIALFELHGNSNVERCRKCKKEYLRDFGIRSINLLHHTGMLCQGPGFIDRGHAMCKALVV